MIFINGFNLKSNAFFTPVEIALGLLLLIKPEYASRMLGLVVGGLLLAKSIPMLISGLKEPDPAVRARTIAPRGFMSLLAVFVTTGSDFIISIIPFLVGLVLLSNGISALQNGIYLKKAGYPRYGSTILFAIVRIALAAIIVFNPFGTALTMVRFIGACLLWDALTGLSTAIQTASAKAKEKKAQKDLRSNLGKDRSVYNEDIPVVDAEIVAEWEE